MNLIITGSVGCGKTTLAKNMASVLNLQLIDLNSIVKEKKLGKKVGSEIEANLSSLKNEVLKQINRLQKAKQSYVIEGHLACEFEIPCDKIIVLRCDPFELEKRLKKRKYSLKKITENALVEALDYCLAQVEENYPKSKIVEIDNTKPKPSKEILKILKSKKPIRSNSKWLKKYLEKTKFSNS